MSEHGRKAPGDGMTNEPGGDDARGVAERHGQRAAEPNADINRPKVAAAGRGDDRRGGDGERVDGQRGGGQRRTVEHRAAADKRCHRANRRSLCLRA
jgi:hypothetical protein